MYILRPSMSDVHRFPSPERNFNASSGGAMERIKRASLLFSGRRFGVERAWMTSFVAMAAARVCDCLSTLWILGKLNVRDKGVYRTHSPCRENPIKVFFFIVHLVQNRTNLIIRSIPRTEITFLAPAMFPRKIICSNRYCPKSSSFGFFLSASSNNPVPSDSKGQSIDMAHLSSTLFQQVHGYDHVIQ
jgi:hypothetical protein